VNWYTVLWLVLLGMLGLTGILWGLQDLIRLLWAISKKRKIAWSQYEGLIIFTALTLIGVAWLLIHAGILTALQAVDGLLALGAVIGLAWQVYDKFC
jgi:hypothetical protein